jgi:tRNA nucleotidyltransferase (CCA-adding enzyme)
LKIFAVGGVIRDQLLGLQNADADYVVVGSTPEEMLQLGYKPVGRDFPVFLHPKTQEEYALARTERKTGKGYKGFSFHADSSVTLEEDLARRDLTINAMAQELDHEGHRFGPIIDPYGGQVDLKNKIFKHVSSAFQEDPLRILRVARFAARFKAFEVDSKTMDFLQVMVANGGLKELVSERVWQEIHRGLKEPTPSRMLIVLKQANAIKELFPKDFLDSTVFENTTKDIDISAKNSLSLNLRFAAFMSHVEFEPAIQWYDKLKIPLEERAYAEIFRIWRHQYAPIDQALNAHQIMMFFDRADLWRKPNRILNLFALADLLGLETKPWRHAIHCVQSIDAGQIAKGLQGQSGEQIKKAVYEARFKAVEISP